MKHITTLLLICASIALIGADSNRKNIVRAEAPIDAIPIPPPAFPDICIPGIPDNGNCCLWEIVRKADGKREAKYGKAYKCDTGDTMRGEMSLTMKLAFIRSVCDQQDIPPNNSKLVAKGEVIRRSDGYAYFSGEFEITDAAGKALFKGRIETTDRLGSHHLSTACETCNPVSHFEGWLVGRGTDAYPNHTIRAFIVARGTVPSPRSPSMVFSGRLTGTLVKCP